MMAFYVTVDNSDAYIHPLVAIFYAYPLDDFTSLHFTIEYTLERVNVTI